MVRAECKIFVEKASQLPAHHGLQKDCLDMTPLHVLSASSTGDSDILFYQYIVEKYPDAMITRDRWSKVPLAYALLGMAPLKIIHFLLATHKNLWQYIPFDFGVMIQRLATKDGASVEFVRDVIRAQRIYFRGLVVDWQQIVAESMIRGYRVPIGMFRVLVEASVSMRSLSMSEEHRVMVNTRVREIEGNAIRYGDHASDTPYEKDQFAFQTRYCRVV
jgi:hypothetical protein